MHQIDALLTDAVRRGASDLHLRSGEPPVVRIDGELRRPTDDAPLSEGDVAALVDETMPDRQRAEFARSFDTDYAYEVGGIGRFRVNAFHDRVGIGAVFRHVPSRVVNVDEVAIGPEVQALCALHRGLVLVTGPTGSGKTTTLCALIDLINRTRDLHIITIEDPIEFVHVGKRCVVTQREVGSHTQSFKSALRAALREDPDVVLIGEMRDLETVSIALETAETGHLVFGTLHTMTAAATVDRIIDQFPTAQQEQIRTMLADALVAVIAQTLCKRRGGGRVAAREVLFNTAAIANLIREGKTFQIPSIMQTSKGMGMTTMTAALERLAAAGDIDTDEAMAHAPDRQAFLAATQRKSGAIPAISLVADARRR